MNDTNETAVIRQTVSEFFLKMGFPLAALKVISKPNPATENEVFEVQLTVDDPQILIGQGGQTLFEVQRILRILLNKKLGRQFYLNVDLNQYKEKKETYLLQLARQVADEVTLTREEKELSPMSSYERRILHNELSKRSEIISESRGEGPDRRVVVKYKQ